MEILLNLKSGVNSPYAHELCRSEINSSFEALGIFTTCHLTMDQDAKSGHYQVTIEGHPRHAKALFSRAEHKSMDVAVKEAIRKLKKQIEKFKEVNYKSSHLNISRS